MDLTTIIVLVFALLFFGGIGFLARSQQKKESPADEGSKLMSQPLDFRGGKAVPHKRR